MRQLLCLLLAATLFAACNDDDPTFRYAAENTAIIDGRFTGTNLHFYGTSVITDPSGDTYTDEDVVFEFAGINNDFALYMHGIRLDPTLPPLKIRIRTLTSIPGIGAKLAFEAESVVPKVLQPNETGGGSSYQPMPVYTMTAFDGAIDELDCRVGFTCDLPEAGIRRIDFEGKLILEW